MKGVLVSYNIPIPSNRNDNNLTFMGSGINFDEKWVLTHGNLFSHLKITRDVLKYQMHSPRLNTNKRYKEFPDIYVQLEVIFTVLNIRLILLLLLFKLYNFSG